MEIGHVSNIVSAVSALIPMGIAGLMALGIRRAWHR